MSADRSGPRRRDFRLGLGRSTDAAKDIEDEFRFHFEMRIAELVTAGLSPEAARLEAQRQFGDLEDARSYCRTEDLSRSRRERWQRRLGDLPSSVRQATRALRRSPTITLAAVFCLALGIGATTAVFSAVHTALLRPLPFASPDELVTIYRTTPNFDTGPFAPGIYTRLATESRTLAATAAVATGARLLARADRSERVSVAQVTGAFFPLLGVSAGQGRLLTAEDDRVGAPAVAVLSAEAWRAQFGGDPAVVGTTLSLDGQPHLVVGILPAGFRVPHGGFMIRADVVVPMRFPDPTQTGSNFLLVLGRLRTGTTVASADAELKTIMHGIVEAVPAVRGEQVRAVAMHRQSMAAVRTPLLLLLGAVGCVLLIACANVAALLLARGLERQREIAIRAAVGAGRSRMVGHVLLETSVLGATGLTLGLVLAWLGVKTIGASAAARMPQLAGFAVDGRMLGFAVAMTAAVTVLCGLVPAWRAAGVDPQDALRAGGRAGGDRRHHRMLRILVTAEVALSLLLLLGAGLVTRGLADLVGRDAGFDPEGLLTMTVSLDPERYRGDRSSYDSFLRPALEAAGRVPGVVGAGSINLVPYDNWGWNFNINHEGRPAEENTRQPLTEIRFVSPSLFATLGIPLIRGRMLDDADRDSTGRALPSVVVNQALVARDFPDVDPIGKRFSWGGPGQWATIIGVVGDIRNSGPESAPAPEVMFSLGRDSPTSYALIIRVAGDPLASAPAVEAALRSVDPTLAVSRVRPMTEVISRSVGRPRFIATLLLVFSLVAVVLTAAGLYGIMSYAVVQRTREIGIRTALGSSARQAVELVLRQGLGLVSAGLLIGLVSGLGLARLLTSFLYGVSPFDLPTWTAGSLVLLLVATAAIVIPARRAARVDPLEAIRAE